MLVYGLLSSRSFLLLVGKNVVKSSRLVLGSGYWGDDVWMLKNILKTWMM